MKETPQKRQRTAANDMGSRRAQIKARAFASMETVKRSRRHRYGYFECVSSLLWFWSCPLPLPSPPQLETVWFPEAKDHNFEGIVFIFGIHLWGVKVLTPIENGQGRVITPGVGAQKPTQIKHFFIVWLKNILPHIFILFYMCRIIFVLHLNPYFVTMGHCCGGVGPL
jgi:hypothetical protein